MREIYTSMSNSETLWFIITYAKQNFYWRCSALVL